MTGKPTRPERRFWRTDVREDIDDELDFHLEMRRRDFAERGDDDPAAREAAARRFGNLREIAEACRQIDEQWLREQRRAGMWADFRLDAAYAVRALTRTPGFTLVAILTLALGVGANTAIFSVINSVLLRPLAYSDTSRLVFVWSSTGSFPREPLTPGRFLDYRERMTSVSAMAGISHIPLNLTGAGDPERLDGSSVSSNFFDVLGAAPLLGEPFHGGRADDRAVVLSHGLWIRRFAADPAIIGRQVFINGTARTVAAVMPRDFDWPAITAMPTTTGGPELWIPGMPSEVPKMPFDRPDLDMRVDRSSGYLRAVARLKAGVTVAQAQSEAEAIAIDLGRRYPDSDGTRGAAVVPLRTQFFGSVRQPLYVLAGAVAFVLAIACANVASLLLGRAAARRTEIAVRLALGAGRGRIVRQLLTESIILALAGATCGLALAAWGQAALLRFTPAGVLRLEGTHIDTAVLAFTLGLAVLTGIIFGLFPAIQASGGAPGGGLNDGGPRASSGRRTARTRESLVAAQIAVALVLLIGSVLLLRSFSALQRIDTGIDTKNLLTFNMFLSGARAEFQSKQAAFYDEVLARIATVPGVTAAGAAVTLPIGGDDFSAPITVEGEPLPPAGSEPSAGFQVVTPGYFAAMGIPLLAGRHFTTADTRAAAPVVLVNRALAVRHWPAAGTDPSHSAAVGRRMRIGREGDWATVVGVVGDIRHLGPATPPRPEFYQPHSQRSFPFMAFVVRTAGDPASTVPMIRAEVTRLDPAQPISGVATMEEHITRSLSRPRFMSTLVGTFGALALTLAVVGIYGVMAYSVAQRRREIAIRIALGARAADVMVMVLSRTLWLTIAGIGAGLAGAAVVTRVLSELVFGIAVTDATTFAGAAAVLAVVALAAGAIPALRATRISGAAALK